MGSRERRRDRSARAPDSRDLPEAEPGFPSFSNNQWTFEGEIERLGAFSRGASKAGGWKRAVAVAVAAAILIPFAVSIVLRVFWLLD